MSPTTEWVIAFVVLAAIVVVIVLIWGDARTPLQGGGDPNPVPAAIEVAAVTDFVSGMTDSYAVSLYKKVTGISLPGS